MNTREDIQDSWTNDSKKMTTLPKTVCLVSLILPLIISGCKDRFPVRVETIHVVNNADHAIQSAVPYTDGPFYPDTALTEIVTWSMQETPPGRIAYYDHHGKGSLAALIESTPEGLISIYVFHPDTLAIHSNQVIIDGYKVLARYDLTLGDLETLDFFVPYPPSDAMGEMRVYVPQ